MPKSKIIEAIYSNKEAISVLKEQASENVKGHQEIKQTIKQDLPEGFQTDDFQLKHGQVDFIIDRKTLKSTLAKLLKWHRKDVISK